MFRSDSSGSPSSTATAASSSPLGGAETSAANAVLSSDTPWFVARGMTDIPATADDTHVQRQWGQFEAQPATGSNYIVITSGGDKVDKVVSGLEPRLPRDPRHWSRDDVRSWLLYLSERHHLPDIRPERFLMNGKALCLMSVSMFTYRVPLGGKLLYKDFQIRLRHALYAEKEVAEDEKVRREKLRLTPTTKL